MIVLSLLFFLVGNVFGGEAAMAANPPQITATLSEPKVRPGALVELKISVKTEEEVDIERPEWSIPNGIENQGVQTRTAFESRLIPGPQGMQFEKKRSIEFVYQLVVQKEGVFKLGPFSVKVDSQNFSVGPVQLEVTAKAPAPSRQRGGGLGGLFPPGFDDEDSLFGQLLRRQRQQEDIPSRNLPINDKEAFFIIVETDKREVFEGEQIFTSWYIYTRGNIHQFDRLKFPALKGFWKEDVEPAPNLNFEKEMVNGVLFHRALLASYALFPIKAGQAMIDEYKIRALVSLPASGFGGFGFGQPYTYTRTSEPLKITVKPLPTEGRPDSFSGAVGNFKVDAHVDHQNFVQGQPFTLKIRFEGDGNAKLIDLPKIQWPETFQIYDTKSESRFFQSGKSFKEFSLLVIPQQAGVLRLPPLEFSYFDPVSATYQTTQTQEIALQVSPGVVQPAEAERMKLPNADIQKLGPVLPEPISMTAAKNWRWLSGLPMLFAWTILYVGLFLIFILAHWLWLKRLYRRKNLMQELNERRDRWEKALKSSEPVHAATEVINAIYFLLSQLAGSDGFTKDLAYLLDQLPPSIRGEVAEPLRRELDVMQTVAFAPEDGWKSFSNAAEFRKHSDNAYQLLAQTVKLSEEGAIQ